MKTLILILVVLALGVRQEKVDLDGLSEKISSQLESNLPGWKYERVPPFGTPETKVIVQSWRTTRKSVWVQIAVRATVEDAKKEIRSFMEFRREPQELIAFGDEAYVPEPNVPSVVFRMGRYVIYINPSVDEVSEADVLAPEAQERRRVELERLGKEFAKLLSTIELPS